MVIYSLDATHDL